MRYSIALSLLGILGLSVANAQDKTYGGRSFDQWKVLVVNDLDPQTRKEAMTAIGVLGHHGHRAPAVEVLQQTVASESETTVVSSAYAALLTFGDAAIPSVTSGLASPDGSHQRVVIQALSVFFSRRGAANRTQFKNLPKKIVPPLLTYIKNPEGNSHDRLTAAKTIEGILRLQEPAGLAEDVLPVLVQVAKTSEMVELSSQAIRTIGRLGKHAASAVPLLVSFVEKDERPRRSSDGQTLVSRQVAAAMALGYIGPAAKDAIPALQRIESGRSDQFTAMSARRALGLIRDQPPED